VEALTQAQVQDLLRRAQELHRAGDLAAAEAIYTQLAAGLPGNADLRHLLGVVAYQRGAARAAIDHYIEALRLRPAFAAAHNNLGLAYKSLGEFEAAARAFDAALAADPRYAEGAYNLALLHEGRGDDAAAEAAYRHALEVRPEWPELLGNLGNLLRRGKRLEHAEPLLLRAAQLRVDDPAVSGNLALLRLDQGRYAEARVLAERAGWWGAAGTAARLMQDADGAVAHLERASRLSPEDAGLWLELGLALRDTGDDVATHAALARARALAPGDPRMPWAQAAALPAFVEDEAHARAALVRFDGFIDELESRAPGTDADADLHAATLALPFPLHYLADDVLARQRRYATLVARAARRACWFDAPRHEAPAEGRIRVGFVGSYLREHVVARYFSALATGIGGEDFERFAWFTGEAADDRTRAIAAGVEHFAHAAGGLRETAAAIHAARLDILVYTDPGLDPRNLALAALRLAPVQVALPGHPASSGLDSIDWFVSGAALEAPGSERDYSEALACLPGLGAVPWHPPAPGDGGWMHALRREGAPLLACPQNPMKVTPAFDDVVAEVLARSGARLVLFDRGAGLTRRLRERMQRALARRGVRPDALHFERLRPYAEYLGGIAAADLVLDTPVFSGGGTSLDALAVGAPVVAFEGSTARGRQTAAMLRLIGVEELIAKDAARYTALAQALLTDPERLRALRSTIAARASLLFDPDAPIRGFAQFLRERAAGLSASRS
jgi:protein O-GlcNAc transferase